MYARYIAADPTLTDGMEFQLRCDVNGKILTSGTGGGGGTGDASAAKQDTGNASLASIDGKMTTLLGYTDGLEGLITSSNTKLDTLHTDLNTTLAGYLDGLEGTLGVTSGAAVTTDANGTLQQYLRGLVTRWANALGAGTAAAALRTTLASDDPAVATLGATSGAAVTTDANGTIQQYLRGLIKQWIAGTLVVGAGTNKIGTVGSTFIAVTGSAMTRPANTTAYAANDAVSDNATAGSVTAQPITLSDTNDDPITVERLRLSSTDTGFAGVSVRAWLYNSDPTASSGVGGGDNAAFSNKKAGFVGTLSGTMRAMSDGSVGVLSPDEGSRIICKPGTGAKTVWWQLQTLGAATPSANSTTFTPTVEGFQGRN